MLDIQGLTVRVAGQTLVQDVSLRLRPGGALALVGASGAGKSTTALALMGLLEGAEVKGRALWAPDGTDPVDLLALRGASLRARRGREVAMVFQDASSALNPVHTVQRHLTEGLRLHRSLSARAARIAALDLLDLVQIPDGVRRLRQYPHELSGGLRQRVMIAAALTGQPCLLIADEPTTALDAPLRAGILDLLDGLRRDAGLALMVITHDLRAVTRLGCDVVQMAAGRVVTRDQAARPVGARTVAPDVAPSVPPLLELRDVALTYPGGRLARQGRVALHGVGLTLQRGETLALVGASGSGKSSLARAILGLEPRATGQILMQGHDILHMRPRALHTARADMQMVFQDPAGSFDPRRTLGAQVGDVLRNYDRPAGPAEIAALLAQVALPPEIMGRYPHQVSGGQCQRVAIARALALNPRLIIADEAISALDAAVQFEILDLLAQLQARLGLGLLLITHDLDAARRISHRLAVMQDGCLVEQGRTADVLAHPRHAHTRALIAASDLSDGPLRAAPERATTWPTPRV
ncbi:ABC transporter ATP-binding protein [Rhodobacteraceae bacterium KMM 6894]|nr:ABC transporter ATP-binding protein [Rhodobacteraceae bacterium KMM 6894]